MINNFIFILYISPFISFHLSVIEVDSAKVWILFFFFFFVGDENIRDLYTYKAVDIILVYNTL